MSILRFLKEIFFCRTEKSGTNLFIWRHTENGKEIICKKVVKSIIFARNLETVGIPWLHYGSIMECSQNVAKEFL